MATYTEPNRNLDFLVSDQGTISFEVVTMLQDASKTQPCVAGTVLGKITSGGKYTPYDDTAAGLVGVGATVAAGILADNVNADTLAAGDVTVRIVKRLAEVKSSKLTWHSSADATAKAAAAVSLDGTNMILIRS
jgi:hypothetical protein